MTNDDRVFVLRIVLTCRHIAISLLKGEAPDPAGWVVEVERTDASVPPGLLALHTGGLATSTTQRRTWSGPHGDRRHHLLDPRTGTSCVGTLAEVTVVASSAAAAEVLTKVAFVAPDRFDDALRAGIQELGYAGAAGAVVACGAVVDVVALGCPGVVVTPGSACFCDAACCCA